MTSPREITAIEVIVSAHLIIFVIGVSWAFGGNADWVRTPISEWGSIGIILTPCLVIGHLRRKKRLPTASHWIWPILLLNAVVALSGLTHGFKELSFHGETLLMPVRVPWWTPSSTVFDTSLRALWLFDGIYFSSLNVALSIGSKRILRFMVALAVCNAVALAIFGIAQKLQHSSGIYFGLVPSPTEAFFSTFVYDNHWGAFIVLMSGACIGMVLRYAHGIRGWGFMHGPGFAGLASACILAASVPLSGSRACTVLLAVLIAYALISGFPRVLSGLQVTGMASHRAYILMGLASVVALAGLWAISGEAVKARVEVTRQQIVDHIAGGSGITRKALYIDTLRMARERPAFGWGMGSYRVAFPLFNTQVRPNDPLPVVYHDAHSDLLQSIAELGIVGTLLLAAGIALPASALFRHKLTLLPVFLLLGCSLVAAYSLVEFPFGNVSVVLSWWFCFIVAVQYQRLSQPSAIGRLMDLAMFSIVVLTMNEERALPDCLSSAAFSNDIVVLDSGSTDRTLDIASKSGARIVKRPFDTFAKQRNYAQQSIGFRNSWVFHLDADERLTPELLAECEAASKRTDVDGFRVAPKMIFEGRWIRHCTDYPAFQARLVRAPEFEFVQVGHGQREAPGMKLANLSAGYLHDISIYGTDSWIEKHRKYAKDEAQAISNGAHGAYFRNLFSSEKIVRRRALKRLSFAMPFRPVLRFIYQYGLRGGFLDGPQGLRYCRLLSLYEGFVAEEMAKLKKKS